MYTIVSSLKEIRIENSNSERPVQSGLLLKVLTAKCVHLTSLHMSRVQFEEELLFALVFKSTLLESVELCFCKTVTDMSMFALSKSCPRLNSLTLRKADVSTKALLSLYQSCPDVNKLNVDTMPIAIEVLDQVAVGVESLTIRNSLGSNYLYRMRDKLLQCVQYSVSVPLYSGAFAVLFSQNPALQQLTLDRQYDVNDAVLESLASLCPLLTSLTINYCSLITDAGWMLLTRLPCLNSLSLMECKVNDAFAEALLRDRPNFTRLQIRSCFGYTGELLRLISKYCSNIKNVTVNMSVAFGNAEVMTLLESCPRLTCLDLQGCNQINDEILPCLMVNSRKFRYVNLEKCGVTKERVEELVTATGFHCTCGFNY